MIEAMALYPSLLVLPGCISYGLAVLTVFEQAIGVSGLLWHVGHACLLMAIAGRVLAPWVQPSGSEPPSG